MLILQNVTYSHPDKDVLFEGLNLSINPHQKIALIGNNGAGKSTLLKIMAGALLPSAGTVRSDAPPYYVPQIFGQYNALTIAQALGIEAKLNALHAILDGAMTDANITALDDDWSIEERFREALSHWNLSGVDLTQKLASLSGGEKTKIFLAGIHIHQPETVLLDEPSNHLDAASREILYDYIRNTHDTLVVVSHDRTLLNLLPEVCELGKRGLVLYGGNYDFYAAQKAIEASAFQQELKNREKALRKAKEVERETLERQQKLDARGKKKQEKSGVPTIMMNTLRNNAEKSTARIKDIHAEKIDTIWSELSQLRKELPDADKMKVGFDASELHTGKILVTASGINYGYDSALLWKDSLSFQITSGERIAVKGGNGAGKTTLIKMILGMLEPAQGTIGRAAVNAIYIDQDYSLINNGLTVYEQAQQYNSGGLQEHEVKSKLTHFLFTRQYWDKSCGTLSGGEKMRLVLCCLTIGSQSPDMMVLDEPTNNLDIQNTEILTAAINAYKGTILVVSHDGHFLEQIGVQRALDLYGSGSH